MFFANLSRKYIYIQASVYNFTRTKYIYICMHAWRWYLIPLNPYISFVHISSIQATLRVSDDVNKIILGFSVSNASYIYIYIWINSFSTAATAWRALRIYQTNIICVKYNAYMYVLYIWMCTTHNIRMRVAEILNISILQKRSTVPSQPFIIF